MEWEREGLTESWELSGGVGGECVNQRLAYMLYLQRYINNFTDTSHRRTAR